MNRALIITYYWPPSGGAGVQRWLKFTKYMRSCGWEPVIYTAENPEMPVEDRSLLKEIPEGTEVLRKKIREPYHLYKKITGRKKEDRINAAFLNEGRKTGIAEKLSIWIRGNLFIPDARKWWIRPSISYLNEYLAKNPVQAIISTGPPHSMHLIALGLKDKFHAVPWIADFRDPWTNIDFYEQLLLSRGADNKHRRLELSVLKRADLVVSVGEHISNELKSICDNAGVKSGNRFRVVTNGYDEEDVKGIERKDDGRFVIAHIGTLVKDRNPEILWKVLARLIRDQVFHERLEIRLTGKVDVFVTERIRSWGLDTYVRKKEYMPHSEVTVEQQQAGVLLLPVNRTKNAAGIITGKVFEYMASGTPILAIGPVDGELAEILGKTGSGLISGFDDETGLENNLLRFYRGETPARNEQEITKYSRKALTLKFCGLLDELVQVVS